jgi:hypothetical protein
VFFTGCFDFAFEHGVCAAADGVSGVFLGSGGGVLVAAFVLSRWEWRNKGIGKESKNRRARQTKGCIKIGLGFGIHKNRLYCRKSVYAFRSERQHLAFAELGQ